MQERYLLLSLIYGPHGYHSYWLDEPVILWSELPPGVPVVEDGQQVTARWHDWIVNGNILPDAHKYDVIEKESQLL